MRLRALLLTAALVGAALGPALAAEPAASDQDRDSARALAKAGIALYQQGRHEEAIGRLGSAEKLFHAPAHLLYMARAHAKLGQLVEAHRLYVDVVVEDIPNYAAPAFHKAQATAREELVALSSKVDGVVITVTGAPAAQVTVTVDGTAVSAPRLAHGVALDPGQHQIEAVSARTEPARRSLQIEAGQGMIPVPLELQPPAASAPAPPPPASAAPVASPPPPQAADEPDDSLVVPGVITLAIGGAALAVGGITGGLTLAQAGDIKDACNGSECPSDQKSEADSAKTLGHVSTAMFVVGGVAAATGIVLLLVPSSDTSAARSSATPTLGARLGPGYGQLFGSF
ncbi:MAG: hypothetical protein JRI68_22650 [Deltaproteobacteria bacterium]|nr:hypothetical protein [Deltaproteobacteria bacterium]